MSLAFSRWSVTADAWFQSQAVLVGFVVDIVALALVFLQILPFSHIVVIPPLFHTHGLFIYIRRYGILAVDRVVK